LPATAFNALKSAAKVVAAASAILLRYGWDSEADGIAKGSRRLTCG